MPAEGPQPLHLPAWTKRFAEDREAVVRAMASVVDPALHRARAREASAARGL